MLGFGSGNSRPALSTASSWLREVSGHCRFLRVSQLKAWSVRQVKGLSSTSFSLPRPLSRLAVEAVGKRGAGSAPRKVNVWRLPSAPPVVLPDRRGPRGGLCRCGGAAKRARASDENFQPRFRHATGPAPPPSLIPGAHQVPVRGDAGDYARGGKGVDKEISVFFIPLLGAETDEGVFQLGALRSVQHPSSDLACASLRLGHLLPQGACCTILRL